MNKCLPGQVFRIEKGRAGATPEFHLLLERIRKLEKKTFPVNEVLEITPQLIAKPSYILFTALMSCPGEDMLVGYAICARWQRRLLLHKLCISEEHRRQGVGKALMNEVIHHARCAHCRGFGLWVDESRVSARALYRHAGFCETKVVNDYYCPGRNGIKAYQPS
jgi:[ribosomal protein S18]-alanine N-acetyltransferase